MRASIWPPPRSLYARNESALIRDNGTPRAVQALLDGLPYNHERRGETLRSFRRVVSLQTAHCLEAALTAAAILEHHGFPPLLLDLESVDHLDHVLFLYRRGGRWGTVARSRDPGLHGRRCVFGSLASLVMSYYDPYIDATGRIRAYGALDLRGVSADWRFSPRNVWKVQDVLTDMPHRRLRGVPTARYGRWKRRYDAFKAAHPDAKPVYYSGRERWLSAGPGIETQKGVWAIPDAWTR